MSSQSRWRVGMVVGLALVLFGAGLTAIAIGAGLLRTEPPATPIRLVWSTPEPLIPTATAAVVETATLVAARQPGVATATESEPWDEADVVTFPPTPTRTPSPLHPTETRMPSAVAKGVPTSVPVPESASGGGLFSLAQRVGVVAPQADISLYGVGRVGAGWYLTGGTELEPERPGEMEFAQMVQVVGGEFTPSAERLQETARRNPGALWLVGNEPDVIWQDNATPQQYAQVYHDVYHVLKDADPACWIAIGGISQVTPLRLRYLEAVLAAYQEMYVQPMPVDVWNIHLAILREERGSWGVDIPPGLPDTAGILYEIQDNADVEILKQQVIVFRRWMAERGQRDRPLIVTEFSVLMPPDYGFPLERVRDFMYSAFDFFVSATDGTFGYPADESRLVQRWAWYSVADRVYSTGNLFDPETRQITPLGRAFARYMRGP